jgi:ferric-dicitrate binding protein FerR (iron transport regulator)
VNRSGAAGQRVEVQRGRLKAAVQPQPPGQPFVFATAIAEVVVKGTALEVEVLDASHSRVIVIEGEVLVRRFSDGEEIDVRAGFHVLFGPTGELHTTANSHLPHHR